MYLLYLDESGAHADARHFVLAGVSVYETNVDWANNELDRLQSEFLPDVNESALFRAAPLRTGEGETVAPPFDGLDRNTHLRLLDRLYDLALRLRGTFFVVVIEKSFLSDGDDPYDAALEQIRVWSRCEI